MTATPSPRRINIRVIGIVQGVGFRPHVYRLATELALVGWVRNDARGVEIEVQGAEDALRDMVRRVKDDAPPLARVDEVQVRDVSTESDGGFHIARSGAAPRSDVLVGPDTATCDDCLRELFDPADRRYRYPFINCTNCGPRFTIVRDVPYDRPLTTMAGFEMCERCRAEYEDPANRRFHAQPNACPVCGPRVTLLDAAGVPVPAGDGAGDVVRQAARVLTGGAILAVKGLGGYHLACRADDEGTVATLRARKHREDKPFALMVPDRATAETLAELGPEEAALLESRQRPIVLAPRLPEAAVAAAVAPGHRDLGLMLPYTPLHHLLLRDVGTPLVMTSGNVSDEPIAFRDDDALTRLAEIADLFLVHDRPIETRTDDSVVRVVRVAGRRQPMMLRRSRGWVPVPIELPMNAPPLLACGAELKNTFCVARGRRAWMGHHIGDLENYETLRSFTEGVEHFQRLFDVEPELVVHDLHPDYLSTKYALDERAELPPLGIQHHHAHLAACLAEHGHPGPAVGAIFDGTGLGTDGTIWGGEILVGDLLDFRRRGWIRPVPMPGGAQAIRQPWRMALTWLVESLGQEVSEIPATLSDSVDPERWQAVAAVRRAGVRSPVTSSAGRLFDGVAALAGVRAEIRYEGQAAIELEMAAAESLDAERGGSEPDPYPLPVEESPDGLVLDPRETIRAILDDIAKGTLPGRIGLRFHESLARATADAVLRIARTEGLTTAVLSGGVFQNVLLLERTATLLGEGGIEVLVPGRLPPNDGGIAFGQVAVAAARSAAGTL